MKIRVKESGNIYDVDAVFVKGGELILPLSDVEILLDEPTATLEEVLRLRSTPQRVGGKTAR